MLSAPLFVTHRGISFFAQAIQMSSWRRTLAKGLRSWPKKLIRGRSQPEAGKKWTGGRSSSAFSILLPGLLWRARRTRWRHRPTACIYRKPKTAVFLAGAVGAASLRARRAQPPADHLYRSERARTWFTCSVLWPSHPLRSLGSAARSSRGGRLIVVRLRPFGTHIRCTLGRFILGVVGSLVWPWRMRLAFLHVRSKFRP
jgi:hypothetical protein